MKKLLIANRGEIAVRVIRAAREMNIPTVAVYAEPDANAIHKNSADESVLIDSYLNITAIIEAAKSTGADAIHPGYGFLSERAEFADACRLAGITFVGPSPEAMRMLGSKQDAKALAVKVGVPIVPGMYKKGATEEELAKAADEIGYPIMLKASAGGGGRGMRTVDEPAQFASELHIAASEALKSFGDDAMMVEKRVVKPRHVEVQILADQHGNIAPLFERECSLQRRHQKVMEEAPSWAWNDQLKWEDMREAAVKLIRAASYTGAGTVEFMVDPISHEFYFLEVNARLQVEHPVTEAITGLDLVKWQLKIADGEVLDLAENLLQGNRPSITGHAIEARIVAEDPAKNFLPSIGKILAWAEPKAPGIRIDTGFGPRSTISPHYDSLIAKVIVHAEDRPTAIAKLKTALLDFHILGVKTNIGYILDLLDNPQFLAGNIDTGFLTREIGDWSPPEPPVEIGAIAERATRTTEQAKKTAQSPWDTGDGFRNARAS